MIRATGVVYGMNTEVEYDEVMRTWKFNGGTDALLETRANKLLEQRPPVFGTYCPDEIDARYIFGVIQEHFFDMHADSIETDIDFDIKDSKEVY